MASEVFSDSRVQFGCIAARSLIFWLAVGFRITSRTARNIFAQSWRQSTSCLGLEFCGVERAESCYAGISVHIGRCYVDIAAMSAQYGTTRVAAEAVRPMIDSTADFRACSTDFHVSLAVVFALRGDNDTDSTSRNCSRKHFVANNSVLYRTCLDMRSFSIRPQTSTIRVRSSL